MTPPPSGPDKVKFLVTLQLQFEVEADENNDERAVDELIEELEKVPLIAVGANIDVTSVDLME